MSRPAGSRVHHKVSAFILVFVIAAAIGIAFTAFAGGFVSTVPVTVTSSRAGLSMNPDAKVKMRGVLVGHVHSIERKLGGAVLNLDMDPSKMSLIPANATVDIRSTTVFGAKYVDFQAPPNPSTDHLESGAVINADRVTVEFNTLFQNLQSVLQAVQPEKLNATLGAISTALRGQGKSLGDTLAAADKYLAQMNSSLPALENDIGKAARVSDIYAGAAPDLVTLMKNGTKVGNTIVDEKDNLNTVLLNAIGLANTGSDVLNKSGDKLVTTMSVFHPTTDLVSEYAPVLQCFISGISNALNSPGVAAWGGDVPGLKLTSGFLLGEPPYKYPNNLPKVDAKNPPNCYGLPWRDPNTNAPYIVTDTGANPRSPETMKPRVNAPTLWGFLLGPPPPGFTW